MILSMLCLAAAIYGPMDPVQSIAKTTSSILSALLVMTGGSPVAGLAASSSTKSTATIHQRLSGRSLPRGTHHKEEAESESWKIVLAFGMITFELALRAVDVSDRRAGGLTQGHTDLR